MADEEPDGCCGAADHRSINDQAAAGEVDDGGERFAEIGALEIAPVFDDVEQACAEDAASAHPEGQRVDQFRIVAFTLGAVGGQHHAGDHAQEQHDAIAADRQALRIGESRQYPGDDGGDDEHHRQFVEASAEKPRRESFQMNRTAQITPQIASSRPKPKSGQPATSCGMWNSVVRITTAKLLAKNFVVDQAGFADAGGDQHGGGAIDS